MTPVRRRRGRLAFAEKPLVEHRCSEDLLTDAEFTDRVARLPFEPGARILAVGDSITDDLQSWAEILRRRWPSLLYPAPDWIICGLGGNDVTRVAGSKPQVTRAESIANLRELRRIAAERTEAQWVWLTPAPVDEERAQAHRPFRFGAGSWHNTDITELADAIRDFEEPVVDLVEVFGSPVHPELQGSDGVHPSLAGQQQIVRAIIRELAVAGAGEK